MAGKLNLEVFDTVDRAEDTIVLTQEALEEQTLAAFEAGYKAGWDDAAAADRDTQTRIRADLARGLQDLSFTYLEARDAVLGSLRPLLTGMAAKVLPAVAARTLAPLIAERLFALGETLGNIPVTVVVNPAVAPAVQALLDDEAGGLFSVAPDPVLDEGQAQLRFGEAEESIDLGGVTAAIQAAVADYFSARPDPVQQKETEDE